MSESNRIRVAYRAAGSSDNWQVMRRTSGGPALTMNTENSNEVIGDRLVSDLILQSAETGGSLEFEFSATSFDDWLSSAFCKAWSVDDPSAGTDTLLIGVDDILFDVLLSYQDIDRHIKFNSMRVGQLDLNVEAGATMTGTIAFAGTDYDAEYDPSGDIFDAATTTRVLRGVDVGTISLDGTPMTGTCIPSLSLSLNNNYQAGFCLGSLSPGKQVKGTAEPTGTLGISMTADTYDTWVELIAQSELSLAFPFGDGTNSYTLTIPRLKASGDLPVPGANEIVNWEWNYTALRDVNGIALQLTRTTA